MSERKPLFAHKALIGVGASGHGNAFLCT